MYIMINNIIDEKTIDLSYSIKNFDSAEIAVIAMFSENIRYEVKKPLHSFLLCHQVIRY